MISSIAAVSMEKHMTLSFHATLPPLFHLQKFLRKARNKKTEYFVLEVTSHSIDQNRIVGIPIKVGTLLMLQMSIWITTKPMIII